MFRRILLDITPPNGADHKFCGNCPYRHSIKIGSDPIHIIPVCRLFIDPETTNFSSLNHSDPMDTKSPLLRTQQCIDAENLYFESLPSSISFP